MQIFDISQEIFSCEVYEGDPAPKKETLCSFEKGDVYQLTAFSMCAHNGTHLDAPLHFLKKGEGVDGISLEKTVGFAYVAAHEGELSAEDAQNILQKAKAASKEAAKRILIKGNATVTLAAAEVFRDANILLVGNESQSVGPLHAPMAVHLALLEKEIVLLEGIRLRGVDEGVYFLCAAPLLLAGADGAPCRALLIRF